MNDLRRQINDAFHEMLHRAYETEQNPLYAWQSIKAALMHGEEIKEWARRYLTGVAAGMLSLEANSIDSDIKRAVGLDGHHVNSYRKPQSTANVWNTVRSYISKGFKPGKAIRAAADDLCMSVDSVSKTYYAHKKSVDALYARYE